MSRKTQIISIIVGTLITLLGIEVCFWLLHNGAFPEINRYQNDPLLGVKLQPSSDQRLQLSPSKMTTIKINENGFRGENFPTKPKDEIFIMGDAQAFGFGIDYSETFGQLLQQMENLPVLNLAVPTYGPIEYNALLEEYITRKPKHIVYTLNLSDDLWEAGQPNTERYSAQNGWLKTETSTDSHFKYIFQNSHALFALRRVIAQTPTRDPTTRAYWLKEYSQRILNYSLENRKKQIQNATAQQHASFGPLQPQTEISMNGIAILERFNELRSLTENTNSHVIIVLIPMDVQIAHTAWSKYPSSTPVNMSKTRRLSKLLVERAAEYGFSAIDMTSQLETISPHSFQPQSPFLSSDGHKLIAEKIVSVLNSQILQPKLPDGRTRVPAPNDWRQAKVIEIDSTCYAQDINEWYRITCFATPDKMPFAIEGPQTLETQIVISDTAMTYLHPIQDKTPQEVTFTWRTKNKRRRFAVQKKITIDWAEDGSANFQWEDKKTTRFPKQNFIDPTVLCECHKRITKERLCWEKGTPLSLAVNFEPECKASCSKLYVTPLPQCLSTYSESCSMMLSCSQGSVEVPAKCGKHQVRLPTTGKCVTPCSDTHPCTNGNCITWHEYEICDL